MSVKHMSQEKTWHISPMAKAIILALSLYLVWMIATYLLEGRINLLQEPTLVGRYVYVLVANVLIGTVGAIWILETFFGSKVVMLKRSGFRSMRRTLVTIMLGIVVGFGLFLLQKPASLAPIVL